MFNRIKLRMFGKSKQQKNIPLHRNVDMCEHYAERSEIVPLYYHRRDEQPNNSKPTTPINKN